MKPLSASSDHTEMTIASVRFVTNKMCPYAQKVWLALEVAQISYQLVEISLYGAGGKPDWFWKLNSAGTVPVVEIVFHNASSSYPKPTRVVWTDSDQIINEIEKGIVLPQGSLLLPKDHKLQQHCLQWRNDINQMLPVGKRAVLTGDAAMLWKILQPMDTKVVGQPFLLGDSITSADCHAFPFLWRLEQEFPKAMRDQCPNIQAWLHTCQQQPLFARTIQAAWWWWW